MTYRRVLLLTLSILAAVPAAQAGAELTPTFGVRFGGSVSWDGGDSTLDASPSFGLTLDLPLAPEKWIAVLWSHHADAVRKSRAAEMKARTLTDGKLRMPFFYSVAGEKPEGLALTKAAYSALGQQDSLGVFAGANEEEAAAAVAWLLGSTQ